MINRRWKRTESADQPGNWIERADRWLKDRLLFLGRTFLWHEMDTRSFSLPEEREDHGPFGQIGPKTASTVRRGAAAAGRAAASPFGAFITVTIGDSAIRVLVARGNRVRGWAEAHLPVGVVQDGLIVDETTFSEAMSRVIDEIGKGAKLSSAKVAVAITGRNVVQRRFTVFLEEGEDLTEAIIDASAERMSIRPEELQLAWDAAEADFDAPILEDEAEDDTTDMFGELEAGLEPDFDGEPYDVYAFGMYRHVLRRNLRTLSDTGAKFSTVQPKAIALAAAANERSGVVLDIEANSITVIVLRDGLPEVVREVGIDQKLTQEQWVQSVTTQVSRTVAFHDSMYPDTPLSEHSNLYLTGAGESTVGSAELAAEAIPYRRKELPATLRAPDDFPFARYAANVGLALVTGKHWWQRTPISIIDRPMLDFRPTEFKPQPFPIHKVGKVAAVVAMVAVIGVAQQLTSGEKNNVVTAKEELANVKRSVGLKDLRIAQAQQQRAEIDRLVFETEALRQKVDLVKDRDRGFAKVVDVITDHVASIADIELHQIDDDGTLVSLVIGGSDGDEVIKFVRRLEGESSFSNVQIRSVSIREPGEEEPVEPSGPEVPPDQLEQQQPITFNVTLVRTSMIETEEDDQIEVALENAT